VIGRRLWLLLPYSIIAIAVGIVLGDKVIAGSSRAAAQATPQKPATSAPASATPQQAGDQHPRDPRGLFPAGGGDRWWQAEDTRKALSLTAQQVAALQKLYDDARPELLRQWEEFGKAQNELDTLIQEGKVSESVIELKVDAMEAPRVKVDRGRIVMLYQMYRVLTPEQQKALSAIRDHGRVGRGGPPHHDGEPPRNER
jgi:Spy/CpxP family protein refolding chaperone